MSNRNKRDTTRLLSRLLTGTFLASEQWRKNLPFLLYLSLLILLMISSSHQADRKVHRINSLREEVKELSSEYIEVHTQLMNESLESKVEEKAQELGLQKARKAPVILRAKATADGK